MMDILKLLDSNFVIFFELYLKTYSISEDVNSSLFYTS